MTNQQKEFWRQADDTEGYPFVVTFKDRATFPPQRFFATLEAAKKEAKSGRAVEWIGERRGDKMRMVEA